MASQKGDAATQEGRSEESVAFHDIEQGGDLADGSGGHDSSPHVAIPSHNDDLEAANSSKEHEEKEEVNPPTITAGKVNVENACKSDEEDDGGPPLPLQQQFDEGSDHEIKLAAALGPNITSSEIANTRGIEEDDDDGPPPLPLQHLEGTTSDRESKLFAFGTKDDIDLPPPTATASVAAAVAQSTIEQINDSDDEYGDQVPMVPYQQRFEPHDRDASKIAALKNDQDDDLNDDDLLHDDRAPIPLTQQEGIDNSNDTALLDAKLAAKLHTFNPASDRQVLSDNDESDERSESPAAASTTTSSPSLPPPPSSSSSNQRERERQSVDLAGDDNGNSRNSTRSLLTATAAAAIAGTDEEHRNSTPMIEAFLVEDEEDGEVYDAILAVPLWKQKRFRISLVCILASILALAISLGVYASKQTITQVVVAASSSPSVSEAPSLSMIPSSSPSACAYKISTNKQVIDSIHPDAIDHMVAIDGREMVVVSRDITGSTVVGTPTGSVYIVFYSLTNDNEWERDAAFTEAVEWNLLSGVYYSVGISGKIAAVGVPSKDEVQIFEQNIYGIWAKVDSLSGTGECGGSGTSVSVDKDLLVFTDSGTCATRGNSDNPLRAIALYPNAAYAFRRVGGKWIPVETFQHSEQYYNNYDNYFDDSFVESNIIALKGGYDGTSLAAKLYRFDRDNATVVHIQDLDSVGAMSEDHIVQSTSSGVTIYQKESESGYIWHSNITEHGAGFGRRLAIDREVLVIGSDNYTHFFMQADGNWESVLTLNKAYEAYQISGRTLVAVDHQSEVHAMNINACTAPEPTQFPTVSTAPVICYLVDVSLISLNYYGVGVQWKIVIQRIESDLVIVKTWSGPEDLDGNLCLPPGQYEISVRLESQTGLSMPIGAHYSVKSDAQTVVKTNFYLEGHRKDTFSLPLPSPKPSVSQPTFDPTEMCFDLPNWKDYNGGCDWYERYDACQASCQNESDMGRATEHCCYCGGGQPIIPLGQLTDPIPTPRPTRRPTKWPTPIPIFGVTYIPTFEKITPFPTVPIPRPTNKPQL